MRDQNRVTGGQLDCPKIIELDDELVFVEERRSGDLAAVVKADRRTGDVGKFASGPAGLPGELAIFDREVGGQWHQEAIRHGINDWRALLDGEIFALQVRAESFGR